ncbi:MAG TPA: two-component regulator propeller domain-containing protein, partial [Anaerolineales bacterium]|nr:two-component regulator propeller domain-containing protein [Anaerolineales bacterium]
MLKQFTFRKYQQKMSLLVRAGLMVFLCCLPLQNSVQAKPTSFDTLSGYGQFTKFLNLDSSDGLADNNVWTVYEDSSNFMWFGTAGGLNRYDAYNFQTFKKEIQNKNSLSENLVRTILEDQHGNIWVGTWEGGLNFIDGRSGEITQYLHSPDDPGSIGGNSIRTLLEDQQGRIWVGTANGGLNLYNPEKNNFSKFRHNADDPNSISSDSIYKLIEDRDGTIWVGTFGGGLIHFDPEISEFTNTEAWQDTIII